ncbi:MAG TPA: acyl-CoA desaturase [Lapillicoccus sp.]
MVTPSAQTAARAGRRSGRTDHVSDFAELIGSVRGLGLLRRRRGAYAVRSTGLAMALVITVAALLSIGDSWYQVAVAVALGVVLSQFGFLAHDAAHRQIFQDNRANEWAARLVSTLVIGLSYGWWLHKHNQHHRSPNQIDRDPDIASGALVFNPGTPPPRASWLRRWRRHQGHLFFPLLLLEGVNLHVAGLRTLLRRPELRFRRLETALIAVHFATYFAVLLLVMSPARSAAFLAVQLGTFGLFLGAAFAPNHKGMPIVPRDAKLDFLRRQVLMSRNIRGGWLVDLLMGGLNYQVEHHLFPNMPRDNLRLARPVVQAYCLERQIPYTETSLVGSYAIVIRYLTNVGLGQRDPFACPFVDVYR